jgi:hypothetical protein
MEPEEAQNLALDAIRHLAYGELDEASAVSAKVHAAGPQMLAHYMTAVCAAGKHFVGEFAPVPDDTEAFYGFVTLPGEEETTDPGDLFAQRFFAAYMNGDSGTAMALFHVMIEPEDHAAIADATCALLLLVVSSGMHAAQHLAQTRSSADPSAN